jgi:hypothetical protein
MEDVIDLIATDASAVDISDRIKSVLYAKAAERVEIAKPYVADMMFNNGESVFDDTDQQEEE